MRSILEASIKHSSWLPSSLGAADHQLSELCAEGGQHLPGKSLQSLQGKTSLAAAQDSWRGTAAGVGVPWLLGGLPNCYWTHIHVPQFFKKPKLKMSEFGVKKGLLMEKAPTQNLRILVMPQIFLWCFCVECSIYNCHLSGLMCHLRPMFSYSFSAWMIYALMKVGY